MKIAITVFALVLAFSLSAVAADITGYVIDQNCASKPAMRGDVECAQKCMKGGSPAVLVTDDGKIYKFSDQGKVLEHAGHKVTITGTLKGDTITVDKIKMS